MKQIPRRLLKVKSFGGGVRPDQNPERAARIVERRLNRATLLFVHAAGQNLQATLAGKHGLKTIL